MLTSCLPACICPFRLAAFPSLYNIQHYELRPRGMALSSPDPGWILPGPFHQGRTWEQAFSHRTSSYPLSGGAESKLKASLSSKPRSVCRYYKTVQIGSCRSEILPSTSLRDPLKWPLPHLAGTGGGCAIPVVCAGRGPNTESRAESLGARPSPQARAWTLQSIAWQWNAAVGKSQFLKPRLPLRHFCTHFSWHS